MLDGTLTPFKLAFDYFAAISNLDFEFSLVQDSFEDSIVFHQVPLIKIRLKCSIFFQKVCVYLEPSNLFQHCANIINYEFRDSKLLVEKAIPEHHVFPHVNILLNQLAELFAALSFNQVWIEQPLGNSYEFRAFCKNGETSESLGHFL